MTMRIGEFANKSGLPISTVRYYIDNGLLIPIKHNGQYRFSETDAYEISLVNKLKSLSFSLTEIKSFLQIIRIYNYSDYRMNSALKKLYADKRSVLDQQIQQLTSVMHKIEMEVDGLDGKAEVISTCNGIPLSSTSALACPKCNSSLRWDHVSLQDNQIHSGLMNCACGYQAHIEDGIIVTDSDVSFYMSEKFLIEHYQNIPDKDNDFVYFEYMNRISERTTAMIHKSYAWMDAVLSNLKTPPKVIILPDLSAHYLYKYINAPYFRDALIIVSGFSKNNILAIKSHFDAIGRDLNILYVANTIFEVPIKRHTIDLWIDAIASYNFSFFHNQNTLHQLLAPYFSADAAVVGLTKYLDPGARSFENIKRTYSRSHQKNSLLPAFHRILKETDWKLETDEVHGYVTAPGEYYEYMEENDKHWFYGYYAKKD